MSNFDILICGAGIAGPTLALLLSHAGPRHNITIIERSPELRTTGQQVDLRLFGITIMERLGLLDDLKAITTEETGIAFVDANDNIKAAYPVEKGGSSQGATSEYEILRGNMAKLLYNRSKDLPNVKYIFGDRVNAIQQKDDKVIVDFKFGASNATYDLVIAADGMRSRTREIAWSQSTSNSSHSPLYSLDQFVAYFSIPISESDLGAAGTGMARWCNAPGRRCMFVRPDHRGMKKSSAYLAIIPPPPTSTPSSTDPDAEAVTITVQQSTRQRLEAAGRTDGDITAQKALFRQLFVDAGWEVERILDGMDKSDDFYLQEIAQVRLSPSAEPPYLKWSRGRVVCVGDAGYCPSPISGMGTSLAVVGAYVLAGEIARAAASGKENDLQYVVSNYEKVLLPYVDHAQKLPSGAPWIANPKTAWGIWILNGILGLVQRTGLFTLVSKFAPSISREAFQLPQYEELGLPDAVKS